MATAAGVRAAAAQGGQAPIAGHALEAGDHRDLAGVQGLAEFPRRNVVDPRPAVGVVGDDRYLPAQPRARGEAHVAQGHGQQAGRHLLAGGDHGVIFVVRGTRPCAAAPAPSVQATSSLVLPAMAETTTATPGPARLRRRPGRPRGGCAPGRPPKCRRISSPAATKFGSLPRVNRGFSERTLASIGRPMARRGFGAPYRALRASVGVDRRPRVVQHTVVTLPASPSSIDPADVARFSAIAEAWWDSHGKFAPLHRLNPVRLAFIRDQALRRFARDAGRRAVRAACACSISAAAAACFASR